MAMRWRCNSGGGVTVRMPAAHQGDVAEVQIVARHQDRQLHVVFPRQRRLIARLVPQQMPAQGVFKAEVVQRGSCSPAHACVLLADYEAQ